MDNKKYIRLSNDEIKEMTFEEVYKEFYSFAYDIAIKYRFLFENSFEDALQSALLGLCKAYINYNRLNIKFSTFAGTIMFNECRREGRQFKKISKNVSLNQDVSIFQDNEVSLGDILIEDFDFVEDICNKCIINKAIGNISKLNSIEKDLIINFTMLKNISAIELAKKYDCSPPTIYKWHKRAIKKLSKLSL